MYFTASSLVWGWSPLRRMASGEMDRLAQQMLPPPAPRPKNGAHGAEIRPSALYGFGPRRCLGLCLRDLGRGAELHVGAAVAAANQRQGEHETNGRNHRATQERRLESLRERVGKGRGIAARR